MKICFVCGEYPPGPHGGIGTMTQVLGRALAKGSHDVRVIGVYPKGYAAPDFEIDEGVRIWRMRDPGTTGSWLMMRYRLYRQIAKWARAGDVEIVEVPDYQGWAAGWGALPVPVVGRLHGSLTYFASELGTTLDKLSFWLERAALRRFDYVCSVCNYTAVRTRQLFHRTLASDTILYNPVQVLPENCEVPRSGNSVVYSGTLTGKKGIASLVQAWPLVVKAHPDAELHIFGKDGRTSDGDSMKEFLITRLNGTAGSVHFHGHVARERLFEAFKQARVAVFPSYAEAFAIAPLEAMACGCPTIYSQRGSGAELLRDGHEGLLIDPDQPGQIADAISRVLSDVSFAQKIGKLGRSRVQNQFSIESLVEQNLAFYESCRREFRARRLSR